jgi:AraC family transcriptional regulator
MNSSKKSLLLDALLYIERNSNSKINLEKIASKSFYSKYHFQREFKELFSVSPKEYVIQIRNEKAAFIIISTDRMIGDIAFEVGFENQETFSRSFKKYFGMSPLQLRNKHRKLEEIPTYPKILIRKKIVESKNIVMIRSTKGVHGFKKIIPKLLSFALQHGIHSFENSLYGRFHDPPNFPFQNLNRIDMGFELPETIYIKPRYPFYLETIPSGEYLSAFHLGSPKEIGSTYNRILSSIKMISNTEIILNPPFELYHRISPFYPEDKSITEILIPHNI